MISQNLHTFGTIDGVFCIREQDSVTSSLKDQLNGDVLEVSGVC